MDKYEAHNDKVRASGNGYRGVISRRDFDRWEHNPALIDDRIVGLEIGVDIVFPGGTIKNRQKKASNKSMSTS